MQHCIVLQQHFKKLHFCSALYRVAATLLGLDADFTQHDLHRHGSPELPGVLFVCVSGGASMRVSVSVGVGVSVSLKVSGGSECVWVCECVSVCVWVCVCGSGCG